MAADENRKYWRQLHPSFLEIKAPYRMFLPSSKDLVEKSGLSVDNSVIWDAHQSYQHYTERLRLQSSGTYHIKQNDVQSAGQKNNLDFIIQPDPIENIEDPSLNNPSHCLLSGWEAKKNSRKNDISAKFFWKKTKDHKAWPE